MEDRNTVIFNDILYQLSNSIKEHSKDQTVHTLKNAYSYEEIIGAHKILLQNLPIKKSTRHARRVKNPDPVVALLDCLQRIDKDDMPVLTTSSSKNTVTLNSAEAESIEGIECSESDDISDEYTDYDELKNEQDLIKAHLKSIFASVQELKEQMKVVSNSTPFLQAETSPNTKKAPIRKICQNIPKSNSNPGKLGLAHLQKLIDQEADSCENNNGEIGLFQDDSDNDFNSIDDFEGYPDYICQEPYKEISVADTSGNYSHKGGAIQSDEVSIEIISQDEKQSKDFKKNPQEIIVNAVKTEDSNSDPRFIVINKYVSTVDESFSCSLCGALFNSEVNLIIHVSTHKSGVPLSCIFCRYTCINAKVMKKHLNMAHSEKQAVKKKRRIFKCVYCGIEYHSKEKMQMHIQNQYEKQKSGCFECQVCFTEFPSRHQLSRHKKLEHASVFPYKCNICGAPFSLKLYLQNHKRTHSNVKPHGCSYCSQRFINRSKLTLHERTHTGEKPFTCSHCPYRSSRQDNMKYHIQSRHVNRTIAKCPRCDQKFPTEDLQDHIAVHSTQLPYQCLECNRLFKSLGGLRVHYKSSQVHNRKV